MLNMNIDLSIVTDVCVMNFNVLYLKTLNLNDRIELGKETYKSVVNTNEVPDNVIAAFGEAFAKVDEMEIEPTPTNVIIEYPTAVEDTNLPIEEPTEETPIDVETPTEEQPADVETSTEETSTEERPTKTE